MRHFPWIEALGIVLLVGVLAAACGGAATPHDTGPAPTGLASPTPSLPGSDLDPSALPKGLDGSMVPAPIESIEIERVAAKPPDATLIVVSGLRSGCESFGGYSLDREGDVILLEVTNRKQGLDCPVTYTTVTTRIPLGQPVYSNILPCKTYTVVVNGETRSVESSCSIVGRGQFSESTPTPIPTSTATPVPVAGPDNLRMSGLYGRLGFTLNWQDNSGNEDGFHIERNGSEIARLPADTILFRDEDLPDGSTFCYRVRAVNEAGFSDYSDEACGTIVWPTLVNIEPVEVSPGQCCIQVTSQSGYLRIGGLYDESARPFDLYFDGARVGAVGCYVTLCEGTFTVPSEALSGDHQVCTQGGSCLTLRVVQAVGIPTPTPIHSATAEWLADLIHKLESEPVANPPLSITQYAYNDQIVYFVPQRCCDIFSDLYDAFGNIIAHPDGGITGGGDGRASDFFEI